MYAGGEFVVVLPLRSQNVVFRLSPLLRAVRSRTSKVWTRDSNWNKPPANSKSELVMVPLGFSDVISRLVMHSGHWNLQTTGTSAFQPSLGRSVSLGNQTPPAPAPVLPAASWCPSAEGDKGTSSAMRVGRAGMSSAIQRKSSNAWWTPLSSKTRG